MTGGATLLNETASPGVVDQADYDAWRANFGAAGGPGSGATSITSAVPEPGGAMLLAWVCLAALRSKKRRRATNQ
jgi:hypothetical protein